MDVGNAGDEGAEGEDAELRPNVDDLAVELV